MVLLLSDMYTHIGRKLNVLWLKWEHTYKMFAFIFVRSQSIIYDMCMYNKYTELVVYLAVDA
jgi:hypothetical protein